VGPGEDLGRRQRFWVTSFALLIWISLSGVLAAAEGPCSFALFPLPKNMSLFGESVPLDRLDVRENLDQALISTAYNPTQVILWIKRAHRYFPYIEKKLQERHLPEDLKYVAIVESAFRTYALSSASALGPWQFIKGTALRYHLRIDKWVDERLNFEKATDAALNYLSDLYGRFKSWNLAVAAYNCGENKIAMSLTLQDVTSYFDTDLPLETEMYNFRIMAAKLILSHPEMYGYKVPIDVRYPPLAHDTVELHLKTGTPILAIARAAGVTFKTIREINPELLQYDLPAGNYRLKVPAGTGKKVNAAFP